jgi:polysaccharide export outer membrane protein
MRLTVQAIIGALSLLSASVAWAQANPAGQPNLTNASVQPLMTAVDTEAARPDASITPLDHLEVTVFREPDLSVEDVLVDESGHIALPLVGGIVASGKSTDELSTEIAAKLREYVKQPEVAVTLKQAASRRVTVTGSVIQPGVYPIEGRLTLLQAVALARGPSQVAAMDDAFIFRSSNGQRQVARFNLDAIAKGKAPDPEVISGDTVSLGSSGFKTAWRDVMDTVRSFNIFRVLP